VYEIPVFMINEPVAFSNEKKKAVPKQKIEENVQIRVRVRKPGVAEDTILEVNNMITGTDLREMYAKQENVAVEKLRLFFAGREMNYSNNLATNSVQNEMVVHAFVKMLEPLSEAQE
jgi:hypothetical protein